MASPMPSEAVGSGLGIGSMELQEQIDKARQEIRADAYSMSIGEWINLYRDEELNVHPEFQRFFRWTPSQKTRLIESILLGIPVPPIFVAQTPDGIWEVVDGLQRLSTIFEFVGILKGEDGDLKPALKLEATKYLSALEGKVWEDSDNPGQSFTQAERLQIKRAKLDVSIILRESGERAKFELFQRLNTGGSPLSDQEVRNCILVMVNRDFFFWLRRLADHPSFQESVALTDRAVSEQYDMEMVTRYMVFHDMDRGKLLSLGDVGEFLTDQIVRFAESEGRDESEADKFKQVFDYISNTIGSNAFRRYDPSRKKHVGGFLVSAFEVVALGLAFQDDFPRPEDFEERVRNLWSNPTFLKYSGAGTRASTRIPQLIPLGRELFRS
ncbi:MAG TPA: DUF262 domain-containing protein [Thermoanaerobaculia bacterium]|nr:DUF262 domain-containing protein [Thermoanaerobaculia bacterium]